MIASIRYRKRSPIGGLAADISAETDDSGKVSPQAVHIDGKLWLEPATGVPLHWRDLAWMAYGLFLHSGDLNAMHPQGLTVKVREFSFPTSDYVPEVAAFAMDEWVRKVFDLPPASIGVEYDIDRSCYVFSMGAKVPFSDEGWGVPTCHDS
ncbi:MAG: hypothetical protein HOY79_24050 [Streptomyces sp.]|nr:hypothetical protein [Streptomyces sp.]